MKTVAIVGFGRFGKTLARLLGSDFKIIIYTRKPITSVKLQLGTHVRVVLSIKEIYEADTVFFCVPIAVFEEVIRTHRQFFEERHVLIDVLSVKLHAQKVFDKYLKGTNVKAILTHPMFGPDSSKNGFSGLPLIMDKYRANDETYAFWKKYFQNKNLKVVEISPRIHDQLAAKSQGLTHFVGRLLDEYGFGTTPIDSLGTQKLHEVMAQTVNDAWQLFENLQHYNPYTKAMRLKLGNAYDRIYNKLLPTQVSKDFVTFGIQGGKGSFNEEAILFYVKRQGIKKFKLKYLYTSERVLKKLHIGDIDLGQFAIHNSVGGVVDESIEAMARYKFHIKEQYVIKISHALMIRSDAQFSEIKTIMTHPQVLAQCKSTLAEKYPQLVLTSGQGDMIDHALVAKELAQRKLPKSVATMGSKVLAKMYGLKIVEDNLQDAKENYTSFLLAERV